MAYKVIDVSEFQGIINWEVVKASGIDGAIIRAADGDYNDIRFVRNMSECKRLGIHRGAYIFSRAKTSRQAEAEADKLIKACAQYECDLPLYIDCEWSGQAGVAEAVCKAFLDRCDSKGVRGGIYANLYWFNNYISAEKFAKYPLWIAQYYTRITHANPKLFGMWQYTSTGSVKGISGNVDLDELYIAYWENGTTSGPVPTKPSYPPKPKNPIKEDGFFYTASVKKLQKWLGTTQDGVISNQLTKCKKYLPNIAKVCEFSRFGKKGGSAVVRALQKRLQITADGFLGKDTVTALQKYLNAKSGAQLTVDGVFGAKTAIAFQHYLNQVA